jgi:hypothetical protein
MLEKIFSARMSGYVDAYQLAMGMDTTMSVFGVELSRALVSIFLKQCPDICIDAAMGMSLPIGSSADMSVKTGPFLVNGQLNARFDVVIKEYKLGSVDLGVQLFSADLGFEFLGIGLDISTPGIEDMTPEYIAKILASLLDVSIEDLLKWLEDPEIKFQPAGSPSSGDSSGQDDGNDSSQQDGDGQNNDDGTSSGSGTPSNQSQGSQGAGNNNDDKEEPDVEATLRNTKGDRFARYACREQDFSWGKATKYEGSGWSYNPEHKDINKASYDRICRDNMTNKTILNNVVLINDVYRPIEVNATLDRTDGELVCGAKGKVCTSTPRYNAKETQINRKGEQRSLVLEPVARRISVAGSSKLENSWHKFTVKARHIDMARMEELFERYDDDKARFKSDGETVKVWLKKLGLKQAGFSLDTISDDISWPWVFLPRDNKKYNVTFLYKNKIPVSPQKVDQYVTIWTKIDSDTNAPSLSDALLVEHCEIIAPVKFSHSYRIMTRRSQQATSFISSSPHIEVFGYSRNWLKNESERNNAPAHCQDPHLDSWQGKTPDQRIQQALKQMSLSISATPEDGKVVVDIDEALSLVGNIIPAILEKRTFETIGKAIEPDSSVTPSFFQVTSIRPSETQREVKFITVKRVDGLRNGSNFTVPIFGEHRDWLQSTHDVNGTPTNYLNTMGSFLSCNNDRTDWINQNGLWLGQTLEPADNDELPLSRPTLLFKDEQNSNSEHLQITQIVGGMGIARFTVQNRLPYGGKHYPELDKKIYKKLLMFPGHKAASMVSLQQNHIEFLTNQQEDLEYVLRYIKPQSSDVMVHIEVRQFCTEQRDDDTQCMSSRFLEQPAGHQFAIGETVINRCLDQLGVSGTSNSGSDRLTRFLSEKDPIVRYGVSALPVLQSLHNNSSFQCN